MTTIDPRLLAGARFLRSFDGITPPESILAAVRDGRTSGVTLFRSLNAGSPPELLAQCEALQAARPAGDPPLLIALDQEGGQLQTVGDGATGWPGNLALGATGSEALARRAGRAIGLEAAALGATMNFAPVCDVLQRASATPTGTRSFGADPALVARLVRAHVEGMASTGIGTTLKHFPGQGAAAGDPHHAMPVLRHSLAQLRSLDLPPFRAGIDAGALAVMPGHMAVPAVSGTDAVPATVSPTVLRGLLRDELGFGGLVISDAMDMGGAAAAGTLDDALVLAAGAGIDLLLMLHSAAVEDAAFDALVEAMRSGRLDAADAVASRDRVLAARARFDAIERPSLDVVGCAEHRALAAEIARASVTLVADPAGVLPLRLADGERIALVAPTPADLTPAETSSYVRLGLAAALRERGLAVDEFVMPLDPTPAQASALAYTVARHAVRIVGTFDAVTFPGQAALLERIAALPAGRAIGVALRSPYDAALVPPSIASICTYGIQAVQMDALADALAGCAAFGGTLPVQLESQR